jgi:Phosphotransferase enzyme family
MSEAPQFNRAAQFDRDKIERYLRSVFGRDVRVTALSRLGSPEEGKGFGYGIPLRVEYESPGLGRSTAVLHTMGSGSFGHEHMADRARILLWSHQAFNRLPRHVHSYDVGAFQAGGDLMSLAAAEEFCLLTEYADGAPYAADLDRLRESADLTHLDVARSDALCDYLAQIHAQPSNDKKLYVRRNRELVGDGECIMGLTDSYPQHPLFTPQILERIEHLAVTWRWRLRNRAHRLRQIHGDFHPWNILFSSSLESAADFRLLDRSRGEYGDPADDVTCITINYLFFSLQQSGRLERAFETLFLRFWDRYLEKTGDREMLEVAPPFFVFRALVLASPVWYPALDDSIRAKLLSFMLNVLEQDRFDPRRVNAYCGA